MVAHAIFRAGVHHGDGARSVRMVVQLLGRQIIVDAKTFWQATGCS